MIKYSFYKVSTMFSTWNGTMERDFLPRPKTWRTIHQTRNHDAAHAQKRVTVPWSNENGDENVTNLHIKLAKTTALHALHERFSLLSISLSSAKQQHAIAKFEVLWGTLALKHKFFNFFPELSAVPTSVTFEEKPCPCHIYKVETVTKWLP